MASEDQTPQLNGSHRSCNFLKGERISKSSVKTIRYPTAIRAGLVTSLEPAIVRAIMRDKSTKLSEVKALCLEGKGWKNKEDREKGRGRERGRGRGKEEEERRGGAKKAQGRKAHGRTGISTDD